MSIDQPRTSLGKELFVADNFWIIKGLDTSVGFTRYAIWAVVHKSKDSRNKVFTVPRNDVTHSNWSLSEANYMHSCIYHCMHHWYLHTDCKQSLYCNFWIIKGFDTSVGFTKYEIWAIMHESKASKNDISTVPRKWYNLQQINYTSLSLSEGNYVHAHAFTALRTHHWYLHTDCKFSGNCADNFWIWYIRVYLNMNWLKEMCILNFRHVHAPICIRSCKMFWLCFYYREVPLYAQSYTIILNTVNLEIFIVRIFHSRWQLRKLILHKNAYALLTLMWYGAIPTKLFRHKNFQIYGT